MASTAMERAERLEAKLDKQRAQKKAFKMRMYEAGAFAGTALAVGLLDTRFPITFFEGRINWGHIALIAGAAMLFLGKGMTQELGSGALYAGAAPLLRDLGARLAGSLP